MLSYFIGAFYFFRSLCEESIFLLPALLGMALVFGKGFRKPLAPEWKCFWTFATIALLWRCLIAAKLQNISRYYQLPGVLLIVAATAGYFAFARFVARWRWGRWASVAVAVAIAGLATGKALHQPKEKPYIAEAVRLLTDSSKPGYLLACTDSIVRLQNKLPGWQVVAGRKTGSKDPVFWRLFIDFVQQHQGKGKALYLLLREAVGEPEHQFRDACRREWGFEPFRLVWQHEERGMRFQLFRCRFATGWFGLPGVTPLNPNPYGLHLPEVIRIDRTQEVTIAFDDILASNPFGAWGGVEFRAPVGQCFDDRWVLPAASECPEEFPISVMLYLPNGWPVGYAEAKISVKGGTPIAKSLAATPHPAADFTRNPPFWKAQPPSALRETPTPLSEGKLSGTIFWIGSRCNGTTWLTDKIAKRHPKLQIMRLELHPKLPHSADPRYTLEDLAFSRGRQNPLLRADGEPDWAAYVQKERIPPDAAVVIALGFEEVHYLGWRSAFHIDRAAEALRRFLSSVMRTPQPSKVLLVMPIPAGDKDSDWCDLANNPYNYGFRWQKAQSFRRLNEAVQQLQAEFPVLNVLHIEEFIPAGNDERYPGYLDVVEDFIDKNTNP